MSEDRAKDVIKARAYIQQKKFVEHKKFRSISRKSKTWPGERAVYTTIGNDDLVIQTIRAELGVTENADIIFQTRNFNVDNILDLTDNSVLRQLGIDNVGDDVLGKFYNTTHIIGTLARKNNFKGIKVDSAADRTSINFILFGE